MARQKTIRLQSLKAIKDSNEFEVTFTVGKDTKVITSPISGCSVYDIIKKWNRDTKTYGKIDNSQYDFDGVTKLDWYGKCLKELEEADTYSKMAKDFIRGILSLPITVD